MKNIKIRIAKVLCFLKGHDWLDCHGGDGFSSYSRHECYRCKAYYDMQINFK